MAASVVVFNNATTTPTNIDNSSSNGINTNTSSNVVQYNGKIIVVSLALLLCVILLIMVLHIYAKWFWSRSSRRREAMHWRRRPEAASMSESSETLGLDPAIINSLPTFIYKVPSPASKDGPLECAVCLSEFQDSDNGRLLPKCNHRFHVTCIDMWFMSHSTCPLCRTNVLTSEAASAMSPTQFEVELGSIRHVTDATQYVLDHNIFSHQLITSGVFRQQTYADDRNDGNSNNNDTSTYQQHALPSPGWLWQRSTSDRFTQAAQIGVQFPTNVLFWGDNAHVNTHTNSLHQQPDGLRPLRHTSSSEELVSRDDIRGSILTSRFVSIGAQLAQPAHLSQQPGKPPVAHLSAFKRLLSRERKVFPTQQDIASSSTSPNI